MLSSLFSSALVVCFLPTPILKVHETQERNGVACVLQGLMLLDWSSAI